MTDNPSTTTVPGQDNIAALREGLTNAIRLIARHREAGALAAELSQHLLSLQDLLAHVEQELTVQALERDELAALYGISQVIGSSLDLTEVLNMDNQYLAVGAEAVLAEYGTFDKFMGDCVVALFNAPLVQVDHVLRAVRAALKIQEGIALLRERMPPAHRLAYGVGINVGAAVVGNIGTLKRVDYTAIGSSVNLARRLQEAAAPGQILLTHAVYQRVREHIEARLLPPTGVQGFSEPITVYELLGLK